MSCTTSSGALYDVLTVHDAPAPAKARGGASIAKAKMAKIETVATQIASRAKCSDLRFIGRSTSIESPGRPHREVAWRLASGRLLL
jgi:hypothetical protein